jgi:hypothetical protein
MKQQLVRNLDASAVLVDSSTAGPSEPSSSVGFSGLSTMTIHSASKKLSGFEQEAIQIWHLRSWRRLAVWLVVGLPE